jgi:hypothetical protein
MIVKQKNQWIVKTSTGKVIAKHKTKKAAQAQLRAIEAAKGHHGK